MLKKVIDIYVCGVVLPICNLIARVHYMPAQSTSEHYGKSCSIDINTLVYDFKTKHGHYTVPKSCHKATLGLESCQGISFFLLKRPHVKESIFVAFR